MAACKKPGKQQGRGWRRGRLRGNSKVFSGGYGSPIPARSAVRGWVRPGLCGLGVAELVVAEASDVRLTVEEVAQTGELVGVPAHRLGDGVVPELAHLALAIAELRHDLVLGQLPAVGQDASDADVAYVGNAERTRLRGAVRWECKLLAWIAHQL